MKKLLIAVMLMVACVTVYARGGGGGGGHSSGSSFGGSRSSGSFSSSPSRSSFGGSRSSGSPATITRSAPAANPSTVVNHTTVINNGSRGYGNSNGLVTGMIVGAALSQPRQVVYVNGQPQQQVVYADGQQQVQQPVVVVSESHPFLWVFIGIVCVIIFVMYVL